MLSAEDLEFKITTQILMTTKSEQLDIRLKN